MRQLRPTPIHRSNRSLSETKKILKKRDYIEGRCSHSEFYSAVVETSGVTFFLPTDRLIERAKKSKEPYFNSIPIYHWNALAEYYRPIITEALRKHGDIWSTMGGVCVLKEAAKNLIAKCQ